MLGGALHGASAIPSLAGKAGAQDVAKGTFTLKGKSAPQTVVFTTTSAPQGQWFDGSFTISRLAFGVGQGEWSDTSTLDDAVQIQFHILQKK